jgi:hypothetical protein
MATYRCAVCKGPTDICGTCPECARQRILLEKQAIIKDRERIKSEQQEERRKRDEETAEWRRDLKNKDIRDSERIKNEQQYKRWNRDEEKAQFTYDRQLSPANTSWNQLGAVVIWTSAFVGAYFLYKATDAFAYKELILSAGTLVVAFVGSKLAAKFVGAIIKVILTIALVAIVIFVVAMLIKHFFV